MAAVKYVEMNPVRAGIVNRAEDWPWSSARAHVFGIDDPLFTNMPIFSDPGAIENWGAWLSDGIDEKRMDTIRRNTMTGRPTGSDQFIKNLERRTGRRLAQWKRGRKRKES